MNGNDVTAEDRNQVEQALYSYCRGLDRFDRDLALSAFAPDAKLVYSGLYEGDAPGFMDWVWPVHTRMLLHVHRVANVFLARGPSGDLVSESYVQVLLRTAADDGAVTDTIGNGRYIDAWKEVDGRLVIAERDYIRDASRVHQYEQLDLSSARPESAGTTLTWARDESDASYRLLGT